MSWLKEDEGRVDKWMHFLLAVIVMIAVVVPVLLGSLYLILYLLHKIAEFLT